MSERKVYPSDVTDEEWSVLETRVYDPYGQPRASTGTTQTPFGFTGELADANGLLYLRARHYAPGIGAFRSLDLYEGSAMRLSSLRRRQSACRDCQWRSMTTQNPLTRAARML